MTSIHLADADCIVMVQAKCRLVAAVVVSRVQEERYVHCIVAKVLGSGVC